MFRFLLLIVLLVHLNVGGCSGTLAQNDDRNRLQQQVHAGINQNEKEIKIETADMFGGGGDQRKASPACPRGQRRTRRGKCMTVVH